MRKVAVFASAKGGVGTTFLAVNVASALAAFSGLKICFVDLDLQSGDANAMLSLRPEKTLGELGPILDEVSFEDIQLVLSRHATGLEYLACPAHAEQAELITPYQVKRLLLVLSQNFDAVIVNTKVGIDERVLAALESATTIFLTTTTEITSLIATKRILNLLTKLNFSLENLGLVLNLVGPYTGVPGEEMAKALAPHNIVAEITFDYPVVPISINQGAPIVLGHGSLIINEIKALASQVLPFNFVPVQINPLARLFS